MSREDLPMKKTNTAGGPDLEMELAKERTLLSHERTELSVLRTRLSFQNSKLSVEQTHLSYVRTTVSLIGSAAAVYKALPALGVSGTFSNLLSLFLLLSAVYFMIRDILTYPKLKHEIEQMEDQMHELEGSVEKFDSKELSDDINESV